MLNLFSNFTVIFTPSCCSRRSQLVVLALCRNRHTQAICTMLHNSFSSDEEWPLQLFVSLLTLLLTHGIFTPKGMNNNNNNNTKSVVRSIRKLYQLLCFREANRHIQCESKKVGPLKLFAIFLLRLSIFPWNFADFLPVYIHTCLPILVDLS